MNTPLVAALLLAGAVVLWLALRALLSLARDRRRGTLVSVDVRGSGRYLTAPALGLTGRPDEIRRLADGRWVPVELKSRTAPRRGPPASHVAQVQAYCLLLEEATGRSPPYGLLRYADGAEWEVPWDPAARAHVLRLIGSVRGRYQGEAAPAVAKCRACGWRNVCDARAA